MFGARMTALQHNKAMPLGTRGSLWRAVIGRIVEQIRRFLPFQLFPPFG
jgi:hypothetical protein